MSSGSPAGSRPLPKAPRELFEALVHYDERAGLEAFLDDFDFDFEEASPHRIYQGVLGRAPESAAVTRMPPGYNARQVFREALLSIEFQRNLVAQILNAFPEKQRLFFVHVPKCAGSDLASHLLGRYPHACIEQKLQGRPYTSELEMLERLQRLGPILHRPGPLVVMGHFPLDSFLSRQLIRFGDAAFTVIREPIAMALSVVNYALTLMEIEPRHRPLVAVGFVKAIHLRNEVQAFPVDAAERKRLALKLLRDPQVLPANNLCRFLGRGDAASALDLCASADIEITTVSRYEPWLRQRWGVAKSVRVNESRRYLNLSDLGSDDIEYLHDISAEDRRFYEQVDRRLASGERLSIPGGQL